MLFPFFLVFAVTLALFNPESTSDDWTLLKPNLEAVSGSVDTLPFMFGLVVNRAEQPLSAGKAFGSAATSLERKKKRENSDLEDKGASEQGDTDSDAELSAVGEVESSETTGLQEETDSDIDLESQWVYPVACSHQGTLKVKLTNGILKDSDDKIGSIVGSRQFQFDGPVPQYGTLYAAGWLVTQNWKLTLGSKSTFYRCESGEYYNLYDAPIGDQCVPVTLYVVQLIDCK